MEREKSYNPHYEETSEYMIEKYIVMFFVKHRVLYKIIKLISKIKEKTNYKFIIGVINRQRLKTLKKRQKRVCENIKRMEMITCIYK